MTNRSDVPSWRELKHKKEVVHTHWRQIQEGKIPTLLKEMYAAYKWENKGLEWAESDAAITVRNVKRAWDNPNVYHYYEFGIGAKDQGISVWCKLDLSSALWSSVTDLGMQLWSDRIKKFNFSAIVDPADVTETDLNECFEYIHRQPPNKPQILRKARSNQVAEPAGRGRRTKSSRGRTTREAPEALGAGSASPSASRGCLIVFVALLLHATGVATAAALLLR